METDDPDNTGAAELQEGVNFWWVPVPEVSKAFYAHTDREAAAAVIAAAAAAAAATAHDGVYVAPATTTQTKKTSFMKLWHSEKTTREDKGEIKEGIRQSCRYPGCGQQYFVGKGDSPLWQLASSLSLSLSLSDALSLTHTHSDVYVIVTPPPLVLL